MVKFELKRHKILNDFVSLAYKAKLIQEETNVKVIYDEPQKSITSGQSAVFYIDDIVIGGGKIQ